MLVLRRLSQVTDSDTAAFYFDGQSDGRGFGLRWAKDRTQFATVVNQRTQVYLASANNFLTDSYSILTVDSVKDGNWFALNNNDHKWVLDAKGARNADKTPIITWEWNNGDNQIWRAEAV